MAAKAPVSIAKPKTQSKQKQLVSTVTMVKSSSCKTTKISDHDQVAMRQHLSGFLTGKSRSMLDLATEDSNKDVDKVDLEMPVTLTSSEWADWSDDDTNAEGEVEVSSDVHSESSSEAVMNSDQEGSVESNTMVRATSPTWAEKVQGLNLNNGTQSQPSRADTLDTEPVSFSSVAMNHKSEVPLIFLVYKRVSTEGSRITLVQIAQSVYR